MVILALQDELLRTKRMQAFAEAITTLKNAEGESSFLILVRQLQNALNKEENFPSAANVSAVPGASLKYLAQPFRFKLQKDATDTTLQQYTHNAGLILVEPLATVTAVEDFLFSRVKPGAVQPSDNEPEPQVEEEENSGDEDEENDNEEGDDNEEDDSDDRSEEQIEEAKDDKKQDAMEVEKPEEKTEEKKEEKSGSTAEKLEDRPDMKKKKTKRSKLKKAKRKQAEKEKEEKEKNLLAEEGSVEDAEDVPEDEEPISSEAVQDIPEEILNQPNVNNAPSTENEEPKRLQLSINGRTLPSNMTMFQALHLYSMDLTASTDVQPTIRLWDQTFNVQYKLVDKDSKTQNNDNQEKIIWRGALNEHSPLDNVLNHPVKFSTSNETVSQILNLMRVLYAINGNLALLIGPKADELTIPRGEWLNGKLKGKILRLLQDPLLLCSRALPQWCTDLMHNCVFMVPHDVRGQFFKATSLGIARALMTVQDQLVQQATRILGAQAAAEQSRFGRIPRFKVRILRDKVLESAVRVMEMVKIPQNSKAILEVEYFNEKGTGLGPTLEFYTLVSRALQRSNLNMWLSTSVTKTREPAEHKSKEDEYEHVFNPNGLFPAPLQARDEKVIDLFEFMGTFIAKALLDGRLLDLPLARPFYKVLLKQELTVDDLFLIAPEIGKTMKELSSLCTAKRDVLKKNLVRLAIWVRALTRFINFDCDRTNKTLPRQ
jgi:E3 ubiquitin-protein ligase TRIP12